MARKDKLTCLEKRDLLNQSAVSVETLIHWGERFESMELFHDAVDFYGKANDTDALNRLMGKASESCDVFLFKRICRFLDRPVDREEWIGLARRAEAEGKWKFAADAYRQGNDEESAVRLLNQGSEPLEGRPPEAQEDEVA